MGKIPNFMDSKRFKTPKTDCLFKFTKTKSFISLDSMFLTFENTELNATLRWHSTLYFQGRWHSTLCFQGQQTWNPS